MKEISNAFRPIKPNIMRIITADSRSNLKPGVHIEEGDINEDVCQEIIKLLIKDRIKRESV